MRDLHALVMEISKTKAVHSLHEVCLVMIEVLVIVSESSKEIEFMWWSARKWAIIGSSRSYKGELG